MRVHFLPTITVALGLAACGGAAALDEGRTTVPRGMARRAAASDAAVEEALRSRVSGDPALPSLAIEVHDGVATLRGTVDHLPAQRRALEIAARTRGVRGIVDRIEVRPEPREDATLEGEIRRALDWHAAACRLAVEPEVSNGVVTLRGEVESLADARLAEDVVAGIRGVEGISSLLRIVPPEVRTDRALRETVEARLRSDLRIDAGAIRVDVLDRAVRLRGSIASEIERWLAEEIASIDGARSVDASGLRVEWWDRARMATNRSTPSDPDLAEAVRLAIDADPRVCRDEIQVSAGGGVVRIDGVVHSLAARLAALEDARLVAGVVEVRDGLRVVPQPLVADVEVDARVSEALALDPWSARRSIDIAVDGGIVRLTGAIESEIEREALLRSVAAIDGVRTIDDRLAVPAAGDDRELAASVRTNLAWNPYLDEPRIVVVVEDGVATLRGEVADERAAEEAEREARSAGVREVRNELEVRATPAP
jgi:osmotically-inducible protein OsmY